MQALNNYFLVFVGGGIGACLRHACNLIGARVAVGSPWPWSTFLINISGALLMGVVVEVFAMRNGASPQLRLLLATGILGGYTTFSTYALEIGLLLQRGQPGVGPQVREYCAHTGLGPGDGAVDAFAGQQQRALDGVGLAAGQQRLAQGFVVRQVDELVEGGGEVARGRFHGRNYPLAPG